MFKLPKDVELLKRKHQKEKSAMQRQHCIVFDKLVATHDKEKQAVDKKLKTKGPASCPDLQKAAEEKVTSHKVKVTELVADHTKEWSDMVQRQLLEEHELRKDHINQQNDVLKKLLEDVQQENLKELYARQEKEEKELKGKQAKQSLESKRDIQNDKAIKNKAERERRVKELQQNHMKKFVDEVKRLTIQHSKEAESLKKQHQTQMEKFLQESKKEIEKADQIHEEAILATKPETDTGKLKKHYITTT
ncbi:hypothetical protein KUTeg_014054 [Tegillarca granosa]|uniref:Phospholipase C-beta C-terminal domain-containing protein n=1 Tax=Tegillarca granosa TaxID=220873 RepID=A0ABQ9F0P8_TEGGR|nr:hypothetical protein KUTeg_014054 [Tegillarca granosa]